MNIPVLKQYVPSDVCLSCEGCCRFLSAKSHWRPKITIEEQKVMDGLLCTLKPVTNKIDQEGYLPTQQMGNLCTCAFFLVEKNECRIYNKRPWDCQLYPFILSSNKKMLDLHVHLSCPYIQDTWDQEDYKDYVIYLNDYFQKVEVLSVLKKNMDCFFDYKDYLKELAFVLTVPISTNIFPE